MSSLKVRLMVWVVASALVLTAAAGVALFYLARAHLIDQFDTALTHRARFLASSIQLDYGELDLEFEYLDMSEFENPEEGPYLQVWFEGESLYRSPSLGDRDLPPKQASPDPSAVRWLDLPDGRHGRGIVWAPPVTQKK